jgi:arylsulfatase A-like enzyme
MPDRPNVLWVCTDQQTADALGCVSPHLDTPAMDRLADRGVRFDRAYCPEPVCGPSRAAMLTGRMPHETGVTENGDAPDEYADRSAGALLRAAGYETAYAGKWHLPSMDPNPGAADYGFRAVGGFDDTRLPGACADFLSDRDGDRPFFLAAHFDDPHNICEWSRNQVLPWGSVEDVPTEECPPLPANFPVPPFEPGSLAGLRRDMRSIRGAIADEWPPEAWRHYRHAYYRLVERVDAGLDRILGALDDAGVRDETVVVFTSDHGDMNGAHRLNQKWALYDESARVPLLVDAPDGMSGAVDSRLVSTGLDLLPTLCDYAGADAPDDLHGRSLRPAVDGDDPDWRDAVVTETHMYNLDGRMVRTDGFKYAVYGRGRHREQLFDMRSDPGEMVNLAVDARHEDVLDAHRERLLDWCAETGDLYMEHYGRPGLPSIPGYEYETVADRFDG